MHSSEFRQYERELALKFSLRDRLSSFLKEHNPELLDNTIAQQEALKDKVDSREVAIEKLGVIETLNKYGISTEGLREENSFWIVPITETLPGVKSLPDGYAFKGGVARSLLLRSLGLDVHSQPRDLDVIRLSETESYPGADDLIAREFMPEDYSHGDGVEEVRDMEEYFSTRDFTINEILADSSQITLTENCLLDSVRRIIRLTDFEKESFGGQANPKMLAKALRLYSETVVKSGLSPDLKNIEAWEFEEYFISPFWLALNMDRAYEQGEDVALEFMRQLCDKRQIPGYIKTTDEAAVFLFGLLEDDSFYYRYAPTSLFSKEDELVKEDRLTENFFTESLLPKHEGMGRRKK